MTHPFDPTSENYAQGEERPHGVVYLWNDSTAWLRAAYQWAQQTGDPILAGVAAGGNYITRYLSREPKKGADPCTTNETKPTSRRKRTTAAAASDASMGLSGG